MTMSNLRSNTLLPVEPAPAVTGFTASTTYVVPANCTQIDILCVGGGHGGSYPPGGAGGAITQASRGVTAGETLTITVGAGGSANAAGGTTSISGSFGTVSAAGGSSAPNYGVGPNGTYVSTWGWYSGGGGERYWDGGDGGGAAGYNLRNTGSGCNAPANSGGGGGGAGGGPGAGSGGSGFVGIFVR